MEKLTSEIFPNAKKNRKYYAAFPFLVNKCSQHVKSNILSFLNNETLNSLIEKITQALTSECKYSEGMVKLN